ncbi:MAG: DNA-binding protein [Firmicutes bacterium]|nr:DNA-binding protein [Bacillota bacterium]
MQNGEELITAHDIATALNLSVETIWRYTRQSKIPYVELGNRQYRYRLSEVLAALTGGEAAQVGEDKAEYQAQQKKLSYQDYLALPEEPGYRYEILDGVLIKDPSPNVLHQRVSRRLQRILEDYFASVDPAGEVFNAPLDVTLGDHTVVQPDLFYIAGGQEQLILHTRIDGAPTLVIEVLSPSTSRKDRLQKLRIYQQAKVPHYWLVNPEENTLECLALNADGKYAIVAGGMDDAVVEPPDFPGLTLELAALWGH